MLRPAHASDTNFDAQDLLRSYLEIQGQLRATQLAVETNRQEAEATAASHLLLLDERLRLMEKTIDNQHTEQMSDLEHSERTILLASGGFAVVGLLVLLLAAFLQWTAVNRLTSIAAGMSRPDSAGQLNGSPAPLPPAQAIEQSNAHFVKVIEALEQRIQRMETPVNTTPVLVGNGSGHGAAHSPIPSSSIAERPNTAADKSQLVNLLFSKSQTLLKLDKPKDALACLDELLSLDPDNADALVKKGAALERLQLPEEAIQCYDHAIARDGSKTMAYLYKGGILNRLERHGEALACYEQALQPGGIPQKRD